MAEQWQDPSLDWIGNVDPTKVYSVLVRLAGAPVNDEQNFVLSWKSRDWHEWRFGGRIDYFAKL